MTLALTIRNPWAVAIILHGKNVENRTWRPAHPGPFPLWVHAGKGYDGPLPGLPISAADCAPFAGTICGQVTVTGVHYWDDCHGKCSTWAMPDQWHWMLTNPRPVEPVPVKGRLGLWQVPEETLTALREEIAR